MKKNLLTRTLIILGVVGFTGWMTYVGLQRDRLEFGIDLKGGSELIFKFSFEDSDSGTKKKLLSEAISVIQDRVNNYGLKDIALQPIGNDRFAVQVSAKDKEKVDAIKSLITDLGRLEMRITVEPDSTDHYETYWKLYQDRLKKGMRDDVAREIKYEDVHKDDKNRYPEGLRWYPLSDTAKLTYAGTRRPKDADGSPAPYVLCELDDHNITGESMQGVRYGREQGGIGGGYAVSFQIKKLDQSNMAALTEFEENKFMGIILNGALDSAPRLRDTLSDRGQITGGFTEASAKSLAAILQAGSLQERPTLIAERTIASELAGTARRRGVLSTAIGFVIVMVIMVFLYRRPGWLANLALLVNLLILVGILTWFGAVLTLPGIAGVVLTVGMAVDANILVFERIKEEKSKGRTVAQAIATGYDRALVTIIDANLTTLITAYFLFQIGSGPVKGFGITLAIGIIASMFTALYMTRTIFEYFLRKDGVPEAKMRGAWAPPTVPWTSHMGKAIKFSAFAMVIGVVLWEVVPDKVKYDLDFTEGSKLIVRFSEAQSLDSVEATLKSAGEKDALFSEISARASIEGIGQQVGQDGSAGFELRSQKIASEQQIDALKAELRDRFKGKLLPGPFQSTIAAGPTGGSVGTMYFTGDRMKADLLKAAFDQYNTDTQRLAGAAVTPAAKVPGAGSAFQLTFKDTADDPAAIALNVRKALADFDLERAKTFYKERSTADTSTKTQQDEAKRILASLSGLSAADLDREFYDECDPFPLADRIDPSTAREHRDAAVRAIALSILGIILYVAFRFRSWSFGFAAVVALIHDVVVVLGLVAAANYLGIVDARLNLVTVAAFLTLIGYSINDSIVVFDRIRENRGTGRTKLNTIVNRSINETLSRTLRTTSTTWVVVVVMLVMNWGANSALEGFAFILALGVLVGTYSSVFIASPTLIFLPWLWKDSGSSVRGLFKKVWPYMVGCAVLLFAIDSLESRIDFAGDFSVEIFNDIALGVPVGLMVFFLLKFLKFVNLEKGEHTLVSEVA